MKSQFPIAKGLFLLIQGILLLTIFSFFKEPWETMQYRSL